MWDVILVGARCGGAATALQFARAGWSVLVLEKAPLGSDTLSTHILIAPAVQQLAALGLLEDVCATGAPPVHKTLFEFDGKSYARPIPEPPGYGLSVRRTTLDPILERGAQAAGATFRHGVHVERLLWEDGRVAGVQGRDAQGARFEERGRLVVGADGRHSLVARLVEAPEYHTIEPVTGALYAYFEGVGPSSAGADVMQIAWGPDCTTLCCPCDGGQHVIILIVGGQEFDQLPASDTAAYETRLRTVPTLAPRLAQARRAGKVHPANPREVRGYFRQPYGPGWALAGDAGECPHPAGAHGIADALRSAELLVQGVDEAWRAGRPAEADLARYQRTRDAENTQPYFFSFRMSNLNPWRDPEIAAMLSGQARPVGPAMASGQARPAQPDGGRDRQVTTAVP